MTFEKSKREKLKNIWKTKMFSSSKKYELRVTFLSNFKGFLAFIYFYILYQTFFRRGFSAIRKSSQYLVTFSTNKMLFFFIYYLFLITKNQFKVLGFSVSLSTDRGLLIFSYVVLRTFKLNVHYVFLSGPFWQLSHILKRRNILSLWLEFVVLLLWNARMPTTVIQHNIWYVMSMPWYNQIRHNVLNRTLDNVLKVYYIHFDLYALPGPYGCSCLYLLRTGVQ